MVAHATLKKSSTPYTLSLMVIVAARNETPECYMQATEWHSAMRLLVLAVAVAR